MIKAIDYTIVGKTTLKHLIERAKVLIDEGGEPYGDLIMEDQMYFREMVKYDISLD